MKSRRSIVATAFSILISLSAYCCGPWVYTHPRPSFLRLHIDAADRKTKAENLLLWRSQTSEKVKLADIDAVIYGDVSPASLCSYVQADGIIEWYMDTEMSNNSFLNYICNTSDTEAFNFVMLARHLARLRADRISPWYYPASKWDEDYGYEPVINTILAYRGERFYNRYSLQLIRALFASARYEECISAFSDRFASVPDDDLMKRMSRDYVAGAAVRLGRSEMAKGYFASAGDVESLSRFVLSDEGEAFRLAAHENPDSPRLLKFIDGKFNGGDKVYGLSRADSVFVKDIIIPVAKDIAARKDVSSKAMWHYIAAIGEGEFNGDYRSAYRSITKADRSGGGEYSDNIRVYRMAVEARLDVRNNLLADLKWLETKVGDVSSPDAGYYADVMQNIVFTILAPDYERRGDLITALQLANYGDNMPLKHVRPCWNYADIYSPRQEIVQARKNAATWNYHDYSNTFFRFMCMQSPDVIERYISSLSSKEPLAAYLNSCGYTDRDYLYDVAGTLYLERRDYADAIRVLAKISDRYQPLLNVDRGGYLKRDPFVYSSGKAVSDFVAGNKKLYFAREMLRLEREMKSTHDPNKRGMDRLKYSIGLENSFNSAWALTSYFRGVCMGGVVYIANYDWPYQDLNASMALNMQKATADAAAMRRQALAEITDPEMAAKAHYMLHNLRTVARHYPDTSVGRMLSARCDAWSDWIR